MNRLKISPARLGHSSPTQSYVCVTNQSTKHAILWALAWTQHIRSRHMLLPCDCFTTNENKTRSQTYVDKSLNTGNFLIIYLQHAPIHPLILHACRKLHLIYTLFTFLRICLLFMHWLFNAWIKPSLHNTYNNSCNYYNYTNKLSWIVVIIATVIVCVV